MAKERFVDRLFDDGNYENIFLEDNSGKEIEFEQIAVVDYDANYYAILKPVTALEGVEEDEVLVFLIDESEDKLIYVEDEDVAGGVFGVFMESMEDDEE